MKTPFSKFKAGQLKSSPNPKPVNVSTSGLGTSNAPPKQSPGLAGLRAKKRNNPLSSKLAPEKPYGQ